MMTAPNKHPDGSSDSPSAPGGFGKVLNSIQGLQQRLGDFSIEVIASAEANAITLIRRLVQLQSQLYKIAELKRALAKTEVIIQGIPEPDYDLIGPDSLEKHPQLHAIVNANKLIRLHKLLKVARASAEAVSFDPNLGRLDVNSPLAPAIAPGRKEKYPDRAEKPRPEPETAKSKPARTTRNESPVIELPPPPTSINVSAQAAAESRPSETVRPTAPGSATDEPKAAAVKLPESPTLRAAVEPAPNNPAKIIDQTPIPEILENRDDVRETRQAPEPARPVQEPESKPKADLTTEARQPPDNTAAAKTVTEFDNERSGLAIDAAFDQRLLDELIQNYGEIIPSTKTSETQEHDASAPQVKAEPTAASVSTPPQDAPEPQSNLSTPADDPLLPPEPKFVAAEPATAVKAAAVETIEVNVPSVRATDELDRQLKKIIQDYGENDIYSQQSSLTLKKSGIAAFIVLGLVLCAVYFLRGPAQTAPAPDPSAVPSRQESAPDAPQTTGQRTGAADELKQKSDGEKTTKAARTETKQIP